MFIYVLASLQGNARKLAYRKRLLADYNPFQFVTYSHLVQLPPRRKVPL